MFIPSGATNVTLARGFQGQGEAQPPQAGNAKSRLFLANPLQNVRGRFAAGLMTKIIEYKTNLKK